MRPEIHATLSTLVGWTTKISVATRAGRLLPTQRRNATNTRPLANACSSVFVRWNISGVPPPSFQSIAYVAITAGRQ